MDDLFTAEEVADQLKVCKAQVYRWIREGKLGSVKFSGTVRVTETQLEEFVQTRNGKGK